MDEGVGSVQFLIKQWELYQSHTALTLRKCRKKDTDRERAGQEVVGEIKGHWNKKSTKQARFKGRATLLPTILQFK